MRAKEMQCRALLPKLDLLGAPWPDHQSPSLLCRTANWTKSGAAFLSGAERSVSAARGRGLIMVTTWTQAVLIIITCSGITALCAVFRPDLVRDVVGRRLPPNITARV